MRIPNANALLGKLSLGIQVLLEIAALGMLCLRASIVVTIEPWLLPLQRSF